MLLGNDRRLILMVGLPRSGKSTKATELSRKYGYPIVSGDAIRKALHGHRFIQEAEPMVHTIAEIMARALFHAGHDTIIIDECNVTKKRRKRWINNFDCRTEYIHINTPMEICLDRAKKCWDIVIEPVIERMAKEFEPINPEEEGIKPYREED